LREEQLDTNLVDNFHNSSRKSEFCNGIKATFPLVVGAIPFGILFGALAVTSGLSAWGTMGMSLIVFAGSAQFIAAGLIGSGAGIGTIILTTLIINLRHVLYATTLAPHMKRLPHKWLVPLGFWLTDESFVVTVKRYLGSDKSPYKHWFFFGSAVFMYTNWQLCTFIGLTAGQVISDPGSWGLDYAMIVTFIGMVVPMVVNRPTLIAIVVAGMTALLANGLPNQAGLFIAALTGISAGVIAERVPDR
jgi:4-azaleucine resistance transporter AzlC